MLRGGGFWLRAANAVGTAALCDGKPHVMNSGIMRIGSDLFVKSLPVRTHIHVERGGRLIIGDRVAIGHGVNISCAVSIEIGSDVRIAPFAMIIDTDYHLTGEHVAPGQSAPIFIGNGVRIGAHATLLRGSRLGEEVEIAPGAVVFGRIAAGTYVAA
jgi:acetyltransferase-like isoleucine patch superfamily enzyme